MRFGILLLASLIGHIYAQLVCQSTGGPPAETPGPSPAPQPFPCSFRSVDALPCPMGTACEFLGGSAVCCPYGNTTCGRLPFATNLCTDNTRGLSCHMTKEYGCIESGSTGTVIDNTLNLISGTCWHRCGVAGWESRTFGPPDPDTACSCTKNCVVSNTCCSDYGLFCSYQKGQGYELPPP